MKVRATQAIMECLLEQEVDTVFGYPGGTILNLYDELYHYQDKIHHVLTAHEQGAAHAADGYARSTGKVGVCFATSGPGATNLTTGIATAYMDSSPVVFITCNVSEGLLGKDSFQEVDITGIAMPITKATYLVRDPQTIPDVMRQAFAVAATGRPGPVLIDFLKNVTFLNTMIDYEFIPWDQNRGTDSIRQLAVSHGLKAPEPDLGDIDTLVEMIAQSERPLLICGGGVVRGRADRQFRAFAEKLDAPVAITVMGGGGFPGAHPLTTGMIGMHGSQASNVACNECDLLIAVGCRFSDRVALQPDTFASQAKIVHIDIDRSEIDKNVLTDHHIVGSAKRVLELLNQRLPQYQHTGWKEHILPLREKQPVEDGADRLTPGQILDAIQQAVPKGSIVATDVGQHQMWSIQHFHFDYPGQLLTSGGFGTIFQADFPADTPRGAAQQPLDANLLLLAVFPLQREQGNTEQVAQENHQKPPAIDHIGDQTRQSGSGLRDLLCLRPIIGLHFGGKGIRPLLPVNPEKIQPVKDIPEQLRFCQPVDQHGGIKRRLLLRAHDTQHLKGNALQLDIGLSSALDELAPPVFADHRAAVASRKIRFLKKAALHHGEIRIGSAEIDGPHLLRALVILIYGNIFAAGRGNGCNLAHGDGFFPDRKGAGACPQKTGVHADDRLADRDMVNHQNRGGRQKQKRQDQKKGNDVNPFFQNSHPIISSCTYTLY